jgi:hypothetical protein
MADSKDATDHSHHSHVPEPLEKLFHELDEIEAIGGPQAHADCARVRATVKEALAAEARGDLNGAVAGITRTMQAIAALAARVDPNEAREMSAVAEQFERALFRGDAAEAQSATEVMRERAGARILKGD